MLARRRIGPGEERVKHGRYSKSGKRNTHRGLRQVLDKPWLVRLQDDSGRRESMSSYKRIIVPT